MRATLLSLTLMAACLPFAVGCSSQRAQVAKAQVGQAQVARGQQADYCPPGAQGNVVYGDYCDDGCSHGPGCCCLRCRPYCVPNDLVYPPPGDLPGIVQYPYYTTKGPDCFFHQ